MAKVKTIMNKVKAHQKKSTEEGRVDFKALFEYLREEQGEKAFEAYLHMEVEKPRVVNGKAVFSRFANVRVAACTQALLEEFPNGYFLTEVVTHKDEEGNLSKHAYACRITTKYQKMGVLKEFESLVFIGASKLSHDEIAKRALEYHKESNVDKILLVDVGELM